MDAIKKTTDKHAPLETKMKIQKDYNPLVQQGFTKAQNSMKDG